MPSTLLALLDDIATLLDDVAVLSKAATRKTAAVLGDDLALNAQQVTGLHADRELPVVLAVAWGSLLNKAILVPSALAISAFAPWAVVPLLMVGGAYLCYEGFEKLAHALFRARDHGAHAGERVAALADPTIDVVSAEKRKIRGAIRTDFILSAEIIVITLGTVARAPFTTQVLVLVAIALLMTVGVYGLVAAIVKLDDAGLHLTQRDGDTRLARIQRRIGGGILVTAPVLMKGLSLAGTAAMFLVGGGILAHGIPGLHDWIDGVSDVGVLRVPLAILLDAITGIVAGAAVFAVARTAQWAWQVRPSQRRHS